MVSNIANILHAGLQAEEIVMLHRSMSLALWRLPAVSSAALSASASASSLGNLKSAGPSDTPSTAHSTENPAAPHAAPSTVLHQLLHWEGLMLRALPSCPLTLLDSQHLQVGSLKRLMLSCWLTLTLGIRFTASPGPPMADLLL